MSLPAYVDRLEDLPEAARSFYVETGDGRFRLDAEGIEDVSGLKSALEKEREARKALKAELAALKPEVDAPEAAAAAAAESEEADEPTDADPIRMAIGRRLLEAEARSAVMAARGSPELLLPVILPRLSVAADPENGAPRIQVIDETGAPLRRETEPGAAPSLGSQAEVDRSGASLLTVAEFVERLRADPLYARAFDGSGKAGSGAPAAGRGDGGPITVPLSDPRAIARHVADIAAGRVRVL